MNIKTKIKGMELVSLLDAYGTGREKEKIPYGVYEVEPGINSVWHCLSLDTKYYVYYKEGMYVYRCDEQGTYHSLDHKAWKKVRCVTTFPR